MTLLVAGVVLAFGRARRRAARMAEEMTEDLRVREAQLERATSDIVRSNRDLERYATIAAHDLQEPLRSILALLRPAQPRFADELGDDAPRSTSIAWHRRRSGWRSLVTDLLAYARLETSENRSQSVDLNVVVRAALGDLNYLIEESGAEVRVGDLPTVVGNERELIGVFANLLSNALKYRSARPAGHRRGRGRETG
ncbi:MAG: hypothetical protein U5R31_06985 [Acidimicrobiia bacterium]|nr:hypothetical protein [Acidimicrobiia bacterium]